MRSVRIGNGCGFWGDNLDAPIVLAEKGGLDYLTLEYLAELTMSILALQKQRDPTAGYAADFLDVLERLTSVPQGPTRSQNRHQRRRHEPGRLRRPRPDHSRQGRPGGSPHRRRRPATICCRASMPSRPAAGRSPTSTPANRCRPCGRAWSAPTPTSAPGRWPRRCASAPRWSITGRVADASLTLAPAVHEFGWAWDDWDRLAGADRGRPSDRVRRPGHRRLVVQLAGSRRSRRRRLSHCGDERGRHRSFSPSRRARAARSTAKRWRSNSCTRSAIPAAYLTPDVVADFTSVALDASAAATWSTSAAPAASRPRILTRCRSPTATAGPPAARW